MLRLLPALTERQLLQDYARQRSASLAVRYCGKVAIGFPDWLASYEIGNRQPADPHLNVRGVVKPLDCPLRAAQNLIWNIVWRICD